MTGEHGQDQTAPGDQAFRPLSEMRLRTNRPPVTRLSRKVLLGGAAFACLAICGALFVALAPRAPKVTRSQQVTPATPATPDALASLPRTYAHPPKSVPKLGPPLPGDLGTPIVTEGVQAPMIDEGAGRSVGQEQEAALRSPLFAKVKATPQQPVPNGANNGVAASAPSEASQQHASPNSKLAFLGRPINRKTVSPDRLETPSSPYILQAGSVIPAALITGIRSDLPGEITAQVTDNVYDSSTGRILLIPQGSRLIGEYDSQIAFGQTRALMVWTRLILPNGRSITLEREPGVDAQGYAGLQDKVDNHWGKLFKAAVLSTVLSVGAEAGTSNSENNLAQALRQGASQSFNQVGEAVVGRSLNVHPTVTIRPGFRVRVLVTRDLVLAPYSE
jgi:type IV secretory pathway VirB10-like protein